MKKPIRASLRVGTALLLSLTVALSSVLTISAVLPKRAVDYTEDFTNEGYADGVLIDNTALPLHEFWVVDQFANYNAAPCSYFETDGDRTVLHIQSYVGILSASEMFDSYTYSVTLRLPKGQNGGVAITARHASGSSHGSLYEADYYRENGGSGEFDRSGFLHDYSGIAVYPTDKTDASGKTLFTVGIKCFEDRGKQRTYNQYFDVYLDVETTEYFTVTFEDKDQVVTVRINDTVICTVEMSDAGTFADPTDTNTYYRRAVLKDAAGNTALELTDAKLAVNARLAIAARSAQCYISDISAYSENDVKTETLPPEADTEPAEPETTAPDTEPDVTQPTESGETPQESDTRTPPETQPDTRPSSAAEAESDAGSAEDGNRLDAILFILFGGLELVLVACLILLILRRKSGS